MNVHARWGMTVAAVLTVIVMSTTSDNAQVRPPAPLLKGMITVTLLQLKPDLAATWDNLMKEELPARKQSGLPWQHVYADGTIGPKFSRLVIRPLSRQAQFDAPDPIVKVLGREAVDRMQAKENGTLVSRSDMVFVLRPDLSLQSTATTLPPLVEVAFRYMRPGKGEDWADVWRDDYITSFAKTGLQDFWVYANAGGVAGVPGGTFLTLRPMPNYAELEKGPMISRVLSGEALATASRRYTEALQVEVQHDVYRVLHDLSYGAFMPAALEGTK